jgi:hypothetical protein
VLDVLERGKLSTTEERQQRTLLSRLLSQLALPPADETAADRRTVTSRKASRAARVRWDREAIHAVP